MYIHWPALQFKHVDSGLVEVSGKTLYNMFEPLRTCHCDITTEASQSEQRRVTEYHPLSGYCLKLDTNLDAIVEHCGMYNLH